MESTSLLENTCASVSVPPRQSTTSRIASHNHSEIAVTKDGNSVSISPTHSRSSHLLPDDTHRAILDIVSPDSTTYSGSSREHDTEHNEIATSKAALDLAEEKLQPRSRFQAIREIVVKFWFWEVAACVFSLLSLASIVGVLIYEDGKPLDTWDWSIPPTATVSFIGTLSKASLVLVLSQILSQLKWLHFREAKSLRDVRIFDGASRGPLGAVLVIWNRKKLLASIGACLMILTILIDPFVQLVFTFPSKLVEDESQQAIFKRIISWDGALGESFNTEFRLPSQGILTSINEGLASANIVPTAVCPSGNCIWSDSIKTLGVCGSCSDTALSVGISCSTSFNKTTKGVCSDLASLGSHVCETNEILAESEWSNTTTFQTCDYTWENGNTVQAHKYMSKIAVGSNKHLPQISRTVWDSTSNGFLGELLAIRSPSDNTTIQVDGQPIQGVRFLNITTVNNNQSTLNILLGRNPLSHFNAIQLPVPDPNDEHDEMPEARSWDCELYWCEKSFEAVQITDNVMPVYKVSSERLWFVFAGDGYIYGLFHGDLSVLNETNWKFRYRAAQDTFALKPMTERFDSYFVQYYLNNKEDVPSQFYWNYPESIKINLTPDTQAVVGLVFSKNLNATIQNLADSLTEFIRNGPNSTSSVGQTFVAKSFIQVRWVWLALPLALLTTTCILLLTVSIKSHQERVAVWKDDPLALLFHNIHGTNILPGSKIGTSDLDNLANEVHVRLDQDRPFQFVVSAKHSTRTISLGRDRYGSGFWK